MLLIDCMGYSATLWGCDEEPMDTGDISIAGTCMLDTQGEVEDMDVDDSSAPHASLALVQHGGTAGILPYPMKKSLLENKDNFLESLLKLETVADTEKIRKHLIDNFSLKEECKSFEDMLIFFKGKIVNAFFRAGLQSVYFNNNDELRLGLIKQSGNWFMLMVPKEKEKIYGQCFDVKDPEFLPAVIDALVRKNNLVKTAIMLSVFTSKAVRQCTSFRREDMHRSSFLTSYYKVSDLKTVFYADLPKGRKSL